MEFRILKYSILFSFILLLNSCSKSVRVNIPGYEQKVVIEGLIETDGFPMVLISKNKNVYEKVSQTELLNSYLSGAQVWVSDGTNTIQLTEICTNNLPNGMDTVVAQYLGIPLDLLSQVTLCAYIGTDPNFKGEIGKTYSLKVDFEGETYTASSTILPPIPIDSAYWKEEVDLPDWGLGHYFLQDPPEKNNAYVFEVRRMSAAYSGQPIDTRYVKVFSPYYDDQFFNGKRFELTFDSPMSYKDSTLDQKVQGYFHRGDTISLKLSNYEYSIYKFYEAINIQEFSGSGPFSTPINAVGNISNGALGLWAALSPAYKTLVCQ